MHISVYRDKLWMGRRNIVPLCCSTMPVNTFVLRNNSVRVMHIIKVWHEVLLDNIFMKNIHNYELVGLG